MKEDSTIHDISDTALWVATYRAIETERPDALFRDPLAAVLAGERGRAIAKEMPGGRYAEWSVIIRTRIIDEFILEKINEGVDLILNLGAGLDTRPYRLNLPQSLRWIEVDFPNIIELKDSRLQNEKPICHLERVSLDLSIRSERKAFFSKIASEFKRVLVLTEGVIPYLTESSVSDLASDIHTHAEFQYWIAEYYGPDAKKYLSNASRRKRLKNSPFQFFPPDWHMFFRLNGWKATEIRYHLIEGEKWGRGIPLPWFMKTLATLATPARQESAAKFSGYALLERM